MKYMRIAGIDPGLAKTGFAIIEYSPTVRRWVLIYHDLIKTEGVKGQKGRAKLLSDRDRTDDISAEVVHRIDAFQADAVSIEDFVFMGSRGRSESQTVRLVESLKVNCKHAGYETAVYDNAYWKDVLMKCRTATKEQVRHYVCRVMGMQDAEWAKLDRGGHLLDAAALALAHAKLLKLRGANVPWAL